MLTLFFFFKEYIILRQGVRCYVINIMAPPAGCHLYEPYLERAHKVFRYGLDADILHPWSQPRSRGLAETLWDHLIELKTEYLSPISGRNFPTLGVKNRYFDIKMLVSDAQKWRLDTRPGAHRAITDILESYERKNDSSGDT
jgi:hypothetical protein